MISEELEDRVREAWAASIPGAYAYREHAKWTGYDSYGAIIRPSPPAPLLEKFFSSFKPHMTQRQERPKPKGERHSYQGHKSGAKPKAPVSLPPV